MWLRSLAQAPKARASHAPARRLRAEALENRSLPSRYFLTDLGTLGGDWSHAADVNADGQVVGSSATASSDHPFLWANGTLIDLGTLGGPRGGANAINDVGQVVGFAHVPDGTGYAFLLTPEDTDGDGRPDRWFRDLNADGANDLMGALPRPAGAVHVGATDVNAAGQVVGNFTDAAGNWHAALWSAGAVTDLGTFGGPTSVATGINDAGQVVGYAQDGQGRNRPFLWDTAHGMTGLGIPAGDFDGDATAITPSGVVVGGANQLGFVWTPSVPNGVEGTATPLYPPPGADFSAAADVTAAGVVIGTAWFFIPPEPEAPYPNEDYYVTGPVIWENGTPTGFVVSGPPAITVDAFVAINATGQIAGVGLVSGHYRHAILLTPDTMPALTVTNASVVEGNTGTRVATFTVILSAVAAQPVTVQYVTADGTATAGGDYQPASGTLTFAPGERTKFITVPVHGDRLPEPDETFVVRLSAATNATIVADRGLAQILDDEPRITVGDVAKREGKKGATTLFVFTVSLSAAYDEPVVVSFRTADGTARAGDGDYVARSGTLTFAPGETTKTIAIEVKGDSKREADESFYLDLFGNGGNSLLVDGRGVGTIVNDD